MIMDAATETSTSRYKAEDRIGVLEELLADRFSCRGFLPQPVPRATIERILTAAQKTASWCNSQPWRLEITSGAATQRFREAMYAAASSGRPNAGDFPFPREYRGIYLERRRESGFQLYNSLGIPRGDKAGYARQALENFNFFGAPHVAIVHTDEALGVYGAIDCGGYVTSFLLAAQALGVATIPQAALAFHSDVVRAHFGLSDDRRVVCGISFGYPDRAHKANSYRTGRAALGDTARFFDE
jgi:nitroreductase